MIKDAERKKKVYLELMRIAACFFVIVNHTNSAIFLSEIPGTRLWFVSITYFFMCKIAVPVFIMISGTLLLDKIDSYEKAGKRCVRMIVVLILFSLFYYMRECYVNKTVFSFVEFILTIWNRNITNAYWYLYIYLGFLMFLPVLQRMAHKMQRKDYLYFICLIIFWGMQPVITHYNPDWGYNGYLGLMFPSAYIGIFFLGYFMDHYVALNSKGMLISSIAFLMTIITQICLTLHEYKLTPDNYMFWDNAAYFPCILASCCAFYCFKYLGEKMRGLWSVKIILILGNLTFGIFLWSDFFIAIWANFYGTLRRSIHPMMAVLVYEVLVFTSGGTVTAILLKIPGIKKLL